MSSKTITRLAWSLCIAIVLFAIIFPLFLLFDRQIYENLSEMTEIIVNLITCAVFAVVGALIISHQQRNTVGWLLLIEASIVIVWPLDIYFSEIFQPTGQLSPLILLGIWIYGWAWLWLIFPILFIPLFFPTGRLLTARWRWVVGLGLGLCIFFILFVTFLTEFMALDESWTVPNPIGVISSDVFPYALWAVLLLSFAGLCVASLFVRYRRGNRVEKGQIKWLFYAALLFFLVYSSSFLFNEIEGFDELFSVLLQMSILLLPLAIGVSILRYRLYDIDIIIRKTLVYAILSALLALTYFGLVVLLQSLFDSLAGEQPSIAIVISTLVIAALFNPLRRRLQDVIDRRFFRKKYDAQKVLAQFSNTVRDETDKESLIGELIQVVEETMQPENVFVYLKVKR